MVRLQVPQMPSRQSWSKGDRLDVLFNEPLVNDVQHLQKGSVRGDIVCGIVLETSAFLRAVLAPNLKVKFMVES